MRAAQRRPPAGGGRRPRAAGLLELASLLAVAATALAVLVAVAAGVRPLVVASGSMRPTLEVGDVVLARSTPAGSVSAGDVVTFLDPGRGGASVTHRVRNVHAEDVGGLAGVRVRTRGDANSVGESWAVPTTTEVGRMAAHLPMPGPWLLHLQTSRARWSLLLLALLLVLAPRLRPPPWPRRGR